MNTNRKALQILMLVAVVAPACVCSAQDEENADALVSIAEPWCAVFGGTEVTYTITVAARKAIRGRATWRLATGQRTLARGEMPLQLDPDTTGRYPVRLALPDVKAVIVEDLHFEPYAILDPPGLVVGCQL